MFITQPVMSGQEPLALLRGEKAELVAITPRAVFTLPAPWTRYVTSRSRITYMAEQS